MSFYQSITNHYHHIFPLNKVQLEFVKSSFEETLDKRLLDIGCGIGELSFELSKYFKLVDAIDLDNSMVTRAKKDYEQENTRLHFKNLNMLNIQEEFREDSFEAVVCFGNTLVHLENADAILNLFKQAKKILTKNGKFLFQIINYDRILDQGIGGLPTIENDHIRFTRKYNLDTDNNKIKFNTELLIKSDNRVIKNSILLYPLRKNEISNLLKRAGFDGIHFFGNFKKDIFSINSIPLIVEAKSTGIA